MSNYFKHLFSALLGRDPYAEEVKVLKEQMNKATDNMRLLQDMYYQSIDLKAETDRQVSVLQELTENLRKRITEKDELIAEYQKEVARLQK